VLCVPAVEKRRYYSVQLVDMCTQIYGYIGSRATGSAAGCYLVAGPSWAGAEAPKGVARVFRCETDFSLAIYRTQIFGPSDMPNVVKVRRATRRSRSQVPGPEAAAGAPRRASAWSADAFKTASRVPRLPAHYAPAVPEGPRFARLREDRDRPAQDVLLEGVSLEQKLEVGKGSSRASRRSGGARRWA
jgi:hypothetical protein